MLSELNPNVLFFVYFDGAAHRDLHLDDVIDKRQLLDTKFLVKRATDAIVFRDDDMEETTYQFR